VPHQCRPFLIPRSSDRSVKAQEKEETDPLSILLGRECLHHSLEVSQLGIHLLVETEEEGIQEIRSEGGARLSPGFDFWTVREA
jgi:hypothetical protein